MLQCEETFILKFTLDANSHADRSKVRRLLEAQIAYEQMSAARSRFVHLLAVVGAFVWIQVIWPDFVGAQVRLVIVALWGSLLALAVWAAIGEYFCRCKLDRCIADKENKPS